MQIDLFGEKAELKVKGKASYPSLQGFFVSFGIFATVLAYAGNKFNTLIDYGGTNFQEIILKDAIDA